MKDSVTGDRLLALFLLGVLAISPPLLAVFRSETLLGGIPLLFLYLFVAWAALILLLAAVVEVGRGRVLPPGPPSAGADE